MMATTSYTAPNTFAQPPTTGPSPPQSYLYQQPYTTPMSQTPPSTTVSPTQYHSHLHVRQLHRPKQPLYIPAALRPTDMIARPADIPNRPRAPLTPPRSAENSFDSKKSRSSDGSDVAGVPIGVPLDGDGMDVLRASLNRAESDGLEHEDPGDVKGEPTRAHWKPDFSTDSCGICHRQFTYFFRRHHCRRCGDVVCGAHLSHTVPLDHNARLHYHARQYRACDTCFTDYKDWMRLRHSRANSIAESQASSQGTAVPSNPGLTIPVHGRSGEANDLRVGSMARSMGMEWSTF